MSSAAGVSLDAGSVAAPPSGFDDPPTDIIMGIDTIGHAMHLAGLTVGELGDDEHPGELALSFLNHLGFTVDSHYSLLVIHDEKDVKDSLRDWEVPSSSGPLRKANFGERSVALFVDRYCRLRAGVLPQGAAGGTDDQQQALQSQQADLLTLKQEVSQAVQVATAASYAVAVQHQAASSASANSTSGPNAFRLGVSLKETVSQVTDATCRKLSEDELAKCFKKYEDQYGKNKKPAPDEEPTASQLGALKFLLDNGENPYADFAVLLPFGDRNLKRQKCMGKMFNDKGEFVSVELVGPASFELWLSSYNILANALLMLGAVDLGNLDEYRKYHTRFHQRHGAMTWALQYQCEDRTRKEQLLRIKRDGYASYLEVFAQAAGQPFVHPYDPDRPWNFVFGTCVDDKCNTWFNEELERPALLIVATPAKVSDVLGGDARVPGTGPPRTPPGLSDGLAHLQGDGGQWSGHKGGVKRTR